MKYRNFFLQVQLTAVSQAQRKRNDEHKIWMTRLPHAQYHNLEPFSKKTILVWWNIVIFFNMSRWQRCQELKEKETMNTRFEWLHFHMLSITIWNLSLKKNYFSMMKYRNFVFLQVQVTAMSRAQRKRKNEHKIWMTTLPHAQYHNLEPFSKKKLF